MGAVRPYVVRQGETLAKIAFEQGFDADEVWRHERNGELKAVRPDPSVLAPEDLLFVPDRPAAGANLAIETENSFRAPVPHVPLVFELRDASGPLANGRCGLWIGQTVLEKNSSADGRVTFEVPVNLTFARLVVDAPPAEGSGSSEARRFESDVLIGHLDPVSTDSGRRARLDNLGYGSDDDRAISDPAPEAAPGAYKAAAEPSFDMSALELVRFQRDQGLEETGEPDEATLDALAKMHGA